MVKFHFGIYVRGCLLSFHLTPFHWNALKGILLIEIQITIWLYYIGYKKFMYEKYIKDTSIHIHCIIYRNTSNGS